MGHSKHSKHHGLGTWRADVRTIQRVDVVVHMGQDSKSVLELNSKLVLALGSKLVLVLGSKQLLALGSILALGSKLVLELGSKLVERNASGAS